MEQKSKVYTICVGSRMRLVTDREGCSVRASATERNSRSRAGFTFGRGLE
jgi:hypothetical protein